MFFEFQKKGLLGLIAVNKNFEGQLMINEETGMVTKFSLSRSNNYLDCGTKIFNRDILNYLPSEYPFNLESTLLPILIAKKQSSFVEIWFDFIKHSSKFDYRKT